MDCPNCGSERVIKRGFRNEIQRFRCKECGRYFTENSVLIDPEIVRENIRLAKKEQNQRDTNRIERKAFREYARIENAIIEYTNKLIETIKEHSFQIETKTHVKKDDSICLLVQISDTHFNEIVDIPGNKYNFQIASKRLKKYADMILQYAKVFKVSEIVLAFTGDLLNSDRRLDEMLSKSTNRAKATFLSANLLQQFIVDLNKIANISIASVTGNESRANDEMGFTNIVATDNYDYTIYNILKIIFKDKKGIHFIDSESMEVIIRIGSENILITHGYDSPKDGIQRFIQQLMGKYAQKGIMISYVIMGHLHSCFISDTFSRSASLVGSNTYNEFALNLFSKASQNIYFVKGKDIDAIKIDLQNVEGYEGYEVLDLGDVYNSKSSGKVKKKETIFEVII